MYGDVRSREFQPLATLNLKRIVTQKKKSIIMQMHCFQIRTNGIKHIVKPKYVGSTLQKSIETQELGNSISNRN